MCRKKNGIDRVGLWANERGYPGSKYKYFILRECMYVWGEWGN